MTPPVGRARRRAALGTLAALSSILISAAPALADSTHDSGSSASDLVLPVIVVVVAVALAAYAYLKRKRRTHTRTTPGRGQDPPRTPPAG
uniref:Secreted protein n=1 Tax=Streptomyces sp. NBC_00003 TaxID=2903608 RepID=A0AAU2V2U0_9ACTN